MDRLIDAVIDFGSEQAVIIDDFVRRQVPTQQSTTVRNVRTIQPSVSGICFRTNAIEFRQT